VEILRLAVAHHLLAATEGSVVVEPVAVELMPLAEMVDLAGAVDIARERLQVALAALAAVAVEQSAALLVQAAPLQC